MLNIQTAGQQKYYDFIEERASKLHMGMIVWSSLLAVAFISAFTEIRVALILGVLGVFLAVANRRGQKELKGKLDNISDKEEFYRQLTETDVLEIPEIKVIVTKDYVLTGQKGIAVYRLLDMEKIEVGKQGDFQKVLFLTDKKGIRHEVISCSKGDGLQEKFDKVYYKLHDRGL